MQNQPLFQVFQIHSLIHLRQEGFELLLQLLPSLAKGCCTRSHILTIHWTFHVLLKSFHISQGRIQFLFQQTNLCLDYHPYPMEVISSIYGGFQIFSSVECNICCIKMFLSYLLSLPNQTIQRQCPQQETYKQQMHYLSKYQCLQTLLLLIQQLVKHFFHLLYRIKQANIFLLLF